MYIQLYLYMYLISAFVDVARQVEVDQFLAELRRALVKAGSNLTEEQCE